MTKRKPLSPEATEALNDVMRKACERMESRLYGVSPAVTYDLPIARAYNAHVRLTLVANERDRLAEENGRVADALGANL